VSPEARLLLHICDVDRLARWSIFAKLHSQRGVPFLQQGFNLTYQLGLYSTKLFRMNSQSLENAIGIWAYVNRSTNFIRKAGALKDLRYAISIP
jgi:hypothetical protein